MIGDINLFLSEDEDSDSDQSPNQENSTNPYHLLPIIGEIEIMLAHTPSRGLGLASESLLTFLTYITLSLPSILEEYRQGSDKSERYLRYLRVKIDKENVKSIRLFEKVGFSKISEEPNYFGEVEMRTGVVGGRIVDVEERIGVEGVGRRIEYGV